METEQHRLTPQAAARELGVSTDTLKRWEADGKIRAARTVGGHRRFEPAEVERVKNGEAIEDHPEATA